MDNSQIWMHPDAYEEALATYDWYAKRNPDAADAFRTELERAKELIVRSPESWPSYIHGTRRCLPRLSLLLLIVILKRQRTKNATDFT